jgi:hypothetical protein
MVSEWISSLDKRLVYKLHHFVNISKFIFYLQCKEKTMSSTEWLKLLTSNHLTLTTVGLNPYRKFWLLSCEEAIQLTYGTSVVLLRYPFVPEIMHGRAPEVFLHQLSWNVAIWPILCRCDVKPNKSNKQTNNQCLHWNMQLRK